jgi:hypothetical protein
MHYSDLNSWIQRILLRVMPKHSNDDSTHELCEEVRQLRKELKELKEYQMIAQASLDASLAGLTSAVNAAVAALATSNTATSTPDTVVAAYQAGVDAQTVALATATPPPVVVPPASLKR